MVKIVRYFLLFFISNLIYSESIESGKTVIANESMVVTRHYLASKVGNEVLLAGGNAIDASVAISFALSVVLPQASPIGGGGFMVIHEAETGENFTIDYREMAPEKATEDMFIVNGEVDRSLALESYLSSGVPGTVYGLYLAHQKFGKLPWKELIKPAIKLAIDGFDITPTLAKSINTYKDKLSKTDDGKDIFFRNGEPLMAGDLLVQKDLGETLTLISKKGPAGFYKGSTAQKIQRDMRLNGGLIGLKDLRNYKAKYREPIEFDYKDLSIVTMAPPSSGGLILGLMFNMLEHIDLDTSNPHDIENIHKIAEIMQIAFSIRSVYLADSDFYEVPSDQFLNKKKAELLSRRINKEQSSTAKEFDPETFKFKENTKRYEIEWWINEFKGSQELQS